MKKTTLLLFFSISSLLLSAQGQLPWEGGVMLGFSNAYGDMIETNISSLRETNLNYGLFVTRHFNPNFSAKFSLFHTTLTGDDANFSDRQSRGLSFRAPLTEAALTANWDILGHWRYRSNSKGKTKFSKTISPYLFLGIGGAYADPVVTAPSEPPPAQRAQLTEDALNARQFHLVTPMGLGVRADFSEQYVFAAELGLRPVFNDYLDGISLAANPDRNDWYGIGSVSMAYRFGNKDTDGDGIADKYDKCPTKPGPKSNNGCPLEEGKDMADSDVDNSEPDEDAGKAAKTKGGQWPWEGGILLGTANFYGDLVDPNLSSFMETNMSYGLFVARNLTSNFSAKASLLHTRLTGDDANYPEKAARGFSFTAPLTEAALTLNWEILGHKRLRKRGKSSKVISPYLFVGVAGVYANPTVTFPSNTSDLRLAQLGEDFENARRYHFTVPMGAGVRADFNERYVFAVEFGMRPVFNDYLDGVSQAGNPNRDDWYGIGTVSVAYRFGNKDTDGDGIADKYDKCPKKPGSKENEGCPDSDGDGVPDHKDRCPTEPGSELTGGCPDSDGDGVPDIDDLCPDEGGRVNKDGCPDYDQDGVADIYDRCPEMYGKHPSGCPDSDGDGVVDIDDACPYMVGPPENKGCPLADRDNDGFMNEIDRCPDEPGTIMGCPDRDGDGIADRDDKCPDIPGTPEMKGCPEELKAEDKEILQLAIERVRFATSRFDLLESSYPVLQQIADLMGRYPNYVLYIDGYTDNRGNEAANLSLSQSRASICKEYIVSLGVDPKRMTATGHGSAYPVANNDTESGRLLNRRVEFKLLPK